MSTNKFFDSRYHGILKKWYSQSTSSTEFLYRQWVKCEFLEFVQKPSADELFDICGLLSQLPPFEAEALIAQFILKNSGVYSLFASYVNLYIHCDSGNHGLGFDVWLTKQNSKGRTPIAWGEILKTLLNIREALNFFIEEEGI